MLMRILVQQALVTVGGLKTRPLVQGTVLLGLQFMTGVLDTVTVCWQKLLLPQVSMTHHVRVTTSGQLKLLVVVLKVKAEVRATIIHDVLKVRRNSKMFRREPFYLQCSSGRCSLCREPSRTNADCADRQDWILRRPTAILEFVEVEKLWAGGSRNA